MGFDGFRWILMGFDGFWWVLMGFDGLWWALMDFDGFWWIFDGFWWISMGSDGFWWVLMGFLVQCSPQVPYLPRPWTRLSQYQVDGPTRLLHLVQWDGLAGRHRGGTALKMFIISVSSSQSSWIKCFFGMKGIVRRHVNNPTALVWIDMNRNGWRTSWEMEILKKHLQRDMLMRCFSVLLAPGCHHFSNRKGYERARGWIWRSCGLWRETEKDRYEHLIDWLMEWLIDWSNHWLIYWLMLQLIDWLIFCHVKLLKCACVGTGYQDHVGMLQATVGELADLEKRAQTSFLSMRYSKNLIQDMETWFFLVFFLR